MAIRRKQINKKILTLAVLSCYIGAFLFWGADYWSYERFWGFVVLAIWGAYFVFCFINKISIHIGIEIEADNENYLPRFFLFMLGLIQMLAFAFVVIYRIYEF